MRRALLGVFLLFVLGCSKESAPSSGGSGGGSTANKPAASSAPTPSDKKLVGACDLRTETNSCIEWLNSGTSKEWIKTFCENNSGTLIDTPCPKEKALGRCVVAKGTTSQRDTLFYPPTAKDAAKAGCTGEFLDP